MIPDPNLPENDRRLQNDPKGIPTFGALYSKRNSGSQAREAAAYHENSHGFRRRRAVRARDRVRRSPSHTLKYPDSLNVRFPASKPDET